MQTRQFKMKEGAGFSYCVGFGKMLLLLCQAVVAMMMVSSAWAVEEGYIDNAQCNSCHKSQKQSYLDSTHGKAFLGDAASGCQSCHGAGAAHKEVAGDENYKGPQKIEAFKKTGSTPDDKNRACLTCHKKDANRSHWEGSTHQSRDLDCASCHQIHVVQDRVLDKRTQTEVCFGCHKEQRTQVNKSAHHPIQEGKMGCSDCHNAHGSSGPKLMKRDSVNATCYTCHMEKRGPFVRPHQPVTEDCSICHNPHGTVAENLLKMRPPFLCHQCHSPHGPATLALTGQITAPAVVGKDAVTYTQGRGCVNCHNQIHGSNNPANNTANPQFLTR